MSNQNSQQVLVSYPSDDSDTPINVVVRDDTIWATQKAISELFDVGKSAISKHLKNIFETNELEENRVVSILETTAPDGKIYKTNHYNLYIEIKKLELIGVDVNLEHFYEGEYEKYKEQTSQISRNQMNKMFMDKISALEPPSTPGPEPDRLKIDMDWELAVNKALQKKRPKEGWPKSEN